jgi:hypothetical protein
LENGFVQTQFLFDIFTSLLLGFGILLATLLSVLVVVKTQPDGTVALETRSEGDLQHPLALCEVHVMTHVVHFVPD